ncbi:hypothetical protein CHIBA101_1776 [Actinomyces sp. Chiba101]|uniref:hypothetical protein n=1 Tax=Actinomyces TaxID=1654 RepID=UPI000974F368|nr:MULTISPECIES: hypothetical protein [Actinomyces]BAW93611.1 hypothetical protein CHIBA101_1776 [Actinomyces sp. Chiba101]GAV93541.1 hypothetical protein ADENT20671_0287 [Actinomyces denticolens]SUU74568.1 Uncharacterised protein [Actinomyces denticolens]
MLDTSQWPVIELDVIKEVQLDPKNVRLESADAKVEADIIEDLFANEHALQLVEGICKVGYLTHETPIVIKQRDRYLMVEGNRRLAALKAIQNPMLVPQFQARISAFASELPNRSSLAKIRVMVAPNQTEAEQLIAAIHTGNLRKPWSPSRQAAFFQAQIDSGRELSELLTRYPTIDVRKFVFRAHVVNLFRSVRYEDTELQDFLSTKQWARGLSTLARIYESKEFLELIGLSMDTNGTITKTVSEAVFKDIATTIVRGMYEKNINTRSLNTIRSPRYIQLMNEIRHIVLENNEPLPTASSTAELTEPPQDGRPPITEDPRGRASESSATAGTNIGETTRTETEVTGSNHTGKQDTKIKSSSRRKKPSNLDLSQVNPPDSYPNALKNLLGELSEINVRKFPNGTFLMIRALLEKSIKAFADAKSIDIKGTGNNTNGRVQLWHALNWLSAYVKSEGPSYLIQVIERLKTGKLVAYTSSGDSLNAVNHNHHFSVDADEAFSMWDSTDSLMRYLMKP